MRIICTGLFLLTYLFSIAQLPKTNLYMLTLLNNGEKITLKDPVYLSGFNPDGYNNQPAFINPASIYITTDKYNKNFTEFVRLDLQNETFYRVTATDSISEYSPTPKAIPNYFSAVRVEKDGTTQSLWLYPEDHSNGGKRLFPSTGNIGYHCWLSEDEVALFLVGESMQLAIGHLPSKTVSPILENIGRCFRQDAEGNLIFVHKISEEFWYLKSYNLESKQATTIAQTVPNSEDFEIISDGTIIMGQGSKLFSLKAGTGELWTELIDLADFEITNITRIASSRNRLVLVSSPLN